MKKFSYAGIVAATLLGAGLMTASLNAAAPTSDCTDRVTGGGWINTTTGESVGFANFGAGGGLLQGNLWGYLNYLDHAGVLHVTARTVVAYCIGCVDTDCRRITYSPIFVNGELREDCEAIVEVCDNNEPGVEDTFSICIACLGYCQGGVLGADDQPSGGNVQLHNADPDCAGAIATCETLLECPCFPECPEE